MTLGNISNENLHATVVTQAEHTIKVDKKTNL